MIGGSVALALKSAGAVGRIIGAGRSRESLDLALQLGAIDAIYDDIADAVAAADVTLLSAPVTAIAGHFAAIESALTGDKILTDAGSVKGGICAAAEAALGAKIARFVPAHPVAGKEHSGIQAAAADLFRNHNVVLTPSEKTDRDATEKVAAMWRITGARVCRMDAQIHDRVLALTSHLPHVLAYAMVDHFARAEHLADAYDMAAGGFYDFTRTASSDPEMWRDICLMNRAEILREVDEFAARLASLRGQIAAADGDALAQLFGDAGEVRDNITERRKPPA